MRYYLAYGSNLNKAQMSFRCPHAKAVGTSEIKDYRLLYKGSQSGSYLTIEKKKGMCVPVAVWLVDEREEKNLDQYEGFPSFYYKKNMKLKAELYDGTAEELECFVYIMHEKRPFGIPGEYYIERCKEGYDDFGFDKEVLDKALEDTRNELEKGKEECRVTGKVREQILSVRETGITNMFDTDAVQRIAFDFGYNELYFFIEEHKKEYCQFILYGK